MKILMISKSLHYSYTGGIQTHVWKLSQALLARGHEVTVLTARSILKSGKSFTDQAINVVPIAYLAGKLGIFHLFAVDEFSFNYFVYRRIQTWLKHRKFDFDVVHLQGRNGFFYPLFRKFDNPPAVVTFHGTMQNENAAAMQDKKMKLRRRIELKLIEKHATWIEKKLLEKCQAVIAVSRQMRRTIRQQFNSLEPKIDIIYNGLDLSEYVPNPERRIPFRLLSVARLDPRKGLSYLIEAAARLIPEFPNLSVHLVGEGSHRSVLQSQIEKLGIGSQVKLIGNKRGEEVLHEYQAAEVFVLPSLGESQGIVFLEAMACELPVIGFDIGGVDEVVSHNTDGLLVPIKDVAALTAAIRRLLEHKNLARKMGESGRRKLESQFRWETIAEQTEQVYHRMIQNFKSGAGK